MEIAGISQLYYAANLEQASAAIGDLPQSVRFSIDSKRLQAECAKPVEERSMPSQQALREEATEVLADWVKKVRPMRDG